MVSFGLFKMVAFNNTALEGNSSFDNTWQNQSEQLTANFNSWTLSEWNRSLRQELIPNDVILALYFFVGIFGNLLVIYVYHFRMKTNKEDRYFIPILALSDLIVCCLGSLYELWMNIVPVDFNGNYFCKFSSFFIHSTINYSAYITLIIAVQRYIKICRPKSSLLPSTFKTTSVFSAVGLSVCFASPSIYFSSTYSIHHKNATGYRCAQLVEKHSQSFYYFFLLAEALTFSVAIAILYTKIGCTISRQRKRMDSITKSPLQTFRKNIESECIPEVIPKTNPMDVFQSLTPTCPRNNKIIRTKSLPLQLENITKRNDVMLSNKGIILSKRGKGHFRTHRYTYLFMMISATFVLSYIPIWIIGFFVNLNTSEFWSELPSGDRVLYMVVYESYLFNHATNPFIYGFFDMSFRKELKTWVKSR